VIEEFAGVENVEVIVRDEGMPPWLSAFLLFINSWVVWAAEKNMVPIESIFSSVSASDRVFRMFSCL